MKVSIINQLPVSRWQEARDLRLFALQESPTAFKDTYANVVDNPQEFWQQRCAVTDEAQPLFAEVNGQLIASLTILYGPEHCQNNEAKIVGMFVSPLFRQQGVAHQLFETAFTLIRAKGNIGKVVLGANPKNARAIALYTKLGFVEVGMFEGSLEMEKQL